MAAPEGDSAVCPCSTSTGAQQDALFQDLLENAAKLLMLVIDRKCRSKLMAATHVRHSIQGLQLRTMSFYNSFTLQAQRARRDSAQLLYYLALDPEECTEAEAAGYKLQEFVNDDQVPVTKRARWSLRMPLRTRLLAATL